MDKFCEVCGADLGPLTGSLEMSLIKVEQLRKWNMDVPTPICGNCFHDILKVAEGKYGKDFAYEDDPPEDLTKRTRELIKRLQVWTVDPFPPGSVSSLGLVSSHVIVGTGPLTALSSAFNDFLGKKSETYAEILQLAEKDCLNILKENAVKKGAVAITGLRVNYTELTGANGMIMVNMLGNAVAHNKIVRWGPS
jgi:uncharacterized protein YbjQ (UPF0145 family)